MAGEQIFIVEDQRIVAEDLKLMLERLGYKVVGTAFSGAEALEKMAAHKPHLVLMDIRIEGDIDGVEVAEEVIARFDIPVVYLTAYADEVTVERAKGTMPSGYILKPFDERSLKTTIELAIYRHKVDRMMTNVEEWHGGILENLGVAVMAMDPKGNVAFMNKAAETLTGRVFEKVFGTPAAEVLPIKDQNTPPPRFKIEREGRSVSIDCKQTAVNDIEGNPLGTALLLTEAKP